MDELHCFTNGTDTVVAHDIEDARVAMREYLDESDTESIRSIDDEKELSIWQDEVLCRGEECPKCGHARSSTRNGHDRTCPIGCPRKTAAEWARENGRGFLCSTEY